MDENTNTELERTDDVQDGAGQEVEQKAEAKQGSEDSGRKYDQSEVDRRVSAALQKKQREVETLSEKTERVSRELEQMKLEKATMSVLRELNAMEYADLFDVDTSTLEGRRTFIERLNKVNTEKVNALVSSKLKGSNGASPTQKPSAPPMSLLEKVKAEAEARKSSSNPFNNLSRK